VPWAATALRSPGKPTRRRPLPSTSPPAANEYATFQDCCEKGFNRVGQGLQIRGDGATSLECYPADPPSTRAMPRYAAAGTYNAGSASTSDFSYGAAGTRPGGDPGAAAAAAAPVSTGNANLDSIIAVSKLAETIQELGHAAVASGAADLSLPLSRPSSSNSAVKSAPVTTSRTGFGTSNLKLVSSSARAPPPARRPPPLRPPPPPPGTPSAPATPRPPPPLRKAPPPGRATPLAAQAKAQPEKTSISLGSLLAAAAASKGSATSGAQQGGLISSAAAAAKEAVAGAASSSGSSSSSSSGYRRRLPPPARKIPPPSKRSAALVVVVVQRCCVRPATAAA
jgi:hypothetical protein